MSAYRVTVWVGVRVRFRANKRVRHRTCSLNIRCVHARCLIPVFQVSNLIRLSIRSFASRSACLATSCSLCSYRVGGDGWGWLQRYGLQYRPLITFLIMRLFWRRLSWAASSFSFNLSFCACEGIIKGLAEDSNVKQERRAQTCSLTIFTAHEIFCLSSFFSARFTRLSACSRATFHESIDIATPRFCWKHWESCGNSGG